MPGPTDQRVYIIDDDDAVRDAMCMLFESVDINYEAYSSGDHFLQCYELSKEGCLVLDIRMQGMNGLELQQTLNSVHSILPIIFITGHGDLPMAVQAMQRGALDFMRKPIDDQKLVERVRQAFALEATARSRLKHRQLLNEQIGTLTDRENEIFLLVTNGEINKVIAARLGISLRTVEVHRAQVMKKLGVRTLVELVRVRIDSER